MCGVSRLIVFGTAATLILAGCKTEEDYKNERVSNARSQYQEIQKKELPADKVLSLPFRPELGRADRDNVIDGYINRNEEDVCAEGNWQKYFTARPEPFSAAEQQAYLAQIRGVSLGSDAFFPFSDNIERAARSGVSYIAQPGGSIRDDLVIEAADRLGITMAFTGVRLFHH